MAAVLNRERQNTNVVKFHALLDKRRPLEQIVYYQVRLTFASVRLNFRSRLNGPGRPRSLASEPTSREESLVACEHGSRRLRTRALHGTPFLPFTQLPS